MTTTTRQSTTTTTYVIRTGTAGVTGHHARASKTMAYTHALATDGGAYSWHTSEVLARKALATAGTEGGLRIVPVEAHQGGKDAVLRRLATEAPAPAPEPQAPAAQARGTRTWDATTAETHTCAGACGKTLPAKSFPTTGKDGRRGVVCRADRDAARAATAA